MKRGLIVLVAVGGALMDSGVQASPIYINPLGENSSTAALSLQSIINARGNTLINVYNDQIDHTAAASWSSSGISGVTVVSAVAGSANINTFGIYNLADPSQKIQIFDGGLSGAVGAINSPWVTFGFYLINNNYGNTEYSDPLLNGGQDHLVAYHGRGESLKLGSDPSDPTGTVLLDANSYLLSWEDTDFNNSQSDQDYNDFTIVLSYASTPDNFTTAGGLGLAMLGLIWCRRAYPGLRKTPSNRGR